MCLSEVYEGVNATAEGTAWKIFSQVPHPSGQLLVVRQVRWRHQLARGLDSFKGGHPTVVAKYITILPEEDQPNIKESPP